MFVNQSMKLKQINIMEKKDTTITLTDREKKSIEKYLRFVSKKYKLDYNTEHGRFLNLVHIGFLIDELSHYSSNKQNR